MSHPIGAAVLSLCLFASAACAPVATAGASDAALSSDGSGSATDGAPATETLAMPGGTPTLPMANAGEIVATIRDNGADTMIRCTMGAATGQPTGRAALTTAGAMNALAIQCAQSVDARNITGVTLAVSRASLAPGRYMLDTMSGAMSSPTDGANLTASLVTNGEGIQATFNGNGGVYFVGELNLERVDGSLVGSFTANWVRVPVVMGGAIRSVRERPGAVAMSFNWPRS